MDDPVSSDPPGGDASGRRRAARGPTPKAAAKPSSARPRAKAAAPGGAAKVVAAGGADKATRSRTAASGAAGRRARAAGPVAAVPGSGNGADGVGTRPEGPEGRDRGPWRGVRSRAVYSRRIQRANERWPLATRSVAGLLRHPELVLKTLGSSEPVERDGRVLNRSVQAMLELAARFDGGGPEGGRPESDPVVIRAQLRRNALLAMPVRTDIHAWGRVVAGPEGAPPVPVRVYRQFGSGLGLGRGDGRLIPCVVYFHGGGWVSGDLDTHDASCRMLAAVARCLVVSVGYRLAPENPFPAAVDDALTAYSWVQRHTGELGVDPRRVGVMGDSAGGNLAAVVALETRTGGRAVDPDVLPPAAQGLIYPAVDARMETDSIRDLADSFFLTRESMELSRARYLPDPTDWTDRRASPLLAEDHRGAAPALVVTAGFDPLRNDGEQYADVLRAAGVPVEYRCYDDQVHGFMGMGILSDSLALATEVCDAMGRLVRRSAAEAPV
jgi:acetyl esterase